MNQPLLFLTEVYSAIQGEGPLVGVRQIFVRLSGCDIRCAWCDTPGSLEKTQYCTYEISEGRRQFTKVANPISVEYLVEILSQLNPFMHHSISFTGGEPLLQSKSLISVFKAIKSKFEIPVYLETGGHRVENLKDVVDCIDYLSMDFKLPSSSSTKPMWDKHEEFLQIALASENLKNIWIKIVVTKDTLMDDLFKAIDIVKSIKLNKNTEIILQPVTEINDIKPPEPDELLKMHSVLLKVYPCIRVLPQVHRLIGQL